MSDSDCVDNIPFPEVRFIPIVPRHPDLVNEPFAREDTGIRPNIIRKPTDTFFKFNVGKGDQARCVVGDLMFGYAEEYDGCERVVSYTSLVDIYNSYGLAVMYSHLRDLYDNCSGYVIHIYILGSVAVIDPDYASSLECLDTECIEYLYSASRALISYLLSELIYRDSQQATVIEQATDMELPEDILARIVGARVSKRLRTIYLANLDSRPIASGEIQLISRATWMSEDGNYHSTVSANGSCEWSCSREGDKFLLNYGPEAEIDGTQHSVASSPSKYLDAFKLRGTNNPLERVRAVLWNGDSTIVSLCSWVVQLMSELEREVPVELHLDETELRELFVELRDEFWATFSELE